MNNSVVKVVISKRYDDLYGEKVFHLPYTYKCREDVRRYAALVKEILEGFLPSEKDYSIGVSYKYIDISYDKYDSENDVTFTHLSDVVLALPHLKLYAQKEVVILNERPKESKELISIHMGHLYNVRLSYSAPWHNTFLTLEPRGRKWDRKYMADLLFRGCKYKMSINDDPYVKGKFCLNFMQIEGKPVTAVYKIHSWIEWEKETHTETVEL